MRLTPKLFVLCGSYREFETWRSENMVSMNNCVYVGSLEHIRGASVLPFQIIHYGNWQNIRGLHEIDKYLKMVFEVTGKEADESRQIRGRTEAPARPAGKGAPKPSQPKQR